MLFRSMTLLAVLYRGYRRLPASQRRRLHGAARRHGFRAIRRHGPRLAVSLLRAARPRV